ncbi:MAG: T9SS type A sorting domain-containing protein [Bacteroidia bacterium]
MNSTTENLTCPTTGVFYDSGGAAGNYGNSQNFTKTFNAPAGSCLRFQFTGLSTESCCDQLRIYDGPTVGSPILGNFFGGANPGVIIPSGAAVTFSFHSDGSTNSSGWTASITCLSNCTGTPNPGVASFVSVSCPPSSSFVTLSSAGATQACGIAYNWQSAPALSGPWTNIAGGTTNPFSTTYTSNPIFYRMRAQCNSLNTIYTNTLSPTTSTIPCGLSTYVPSTTPYTFDVFAGTTLPTTDDVLFATTVNFGFPFCFSGTQYWGGYVASNCAFVFDAVPCYPNILVSTYAAGGVGTGYTIPNTGAPDNNSSIPRNAILAPWQDTDPSLGGVMRYATLGVAPNRRFVASWENIPMYSCGTAQPGIYYTGQVKLFETSNNIEIHIGNKGCCVGWNGQDAVLGLHNYDGTVYIPQVNATAHNAPTNWTMTNTAYRYISPCAAAGGPCLTLPTNFKSFYGQQIEATNKLSWETSVEENISEFIIERSSDAINFTEAGRALPNNRPSKYDFNDNTFKPSIVNYYKITALGTDGKRNSTYVLPIEGNYEDLNMSEIYPNPVKDNFTITFTAKTEIQTEIIIKDMFGRIVKTSHHSLSGGNTKTIINCPELNQGIYIVEVLSENKIISQQKLIVVK